MYFVYIIVIIVVVCLVCIGLAFCFMKHYWGSHRRAVQRSAEAKRRRREAAAGARAEASSEGGSAAPSAAGAADGTDGVPAALPHVSAYAKRMAALLNEDPLGYVIPTGNAIIQKGVSPSSSGNAGTPRHAGESSTSAHSGEADGHIPEDNDALGSPDTLSRLVSEYTVVSVVGNDDHSESVTVTDVAPRAGDASLAESIAPSRNVSALALHRPPPVARAGEWFPTVAQRQSAAPGSSPSPATPPDTAYRRYVATTAAAGADDDVTVSQDHAADLSSDGEESASGLSVAARRVHHRHHLNNGGYVVVVREREQTAEEAAAGLPPVTERVVLQRRPSELIYGRAAYMQHQHGAERVGREGIEEDTATECQVVVQPAGSATEREEGGPSCPKAGAVEGIVSTPPPPP